LKGNHRGTNVNADTDTDVEVIQECRPSLTEAAIEDLERNSVYFTRD
jgi:hypothetical protein